jgi:hypothetical protein
MDPINETVYAIYDIDEESIGKVSKTLDLCKQELELSIIENFNTEIDRINTKLSALKLELDEKLKKSKLVVKKPVKKPVKKTTKKSNKKSNDSSESESESESENESENETSIESVQIL